MKSKRSVQQIYHRQLYLTEVKCMTYAVNYNKGQLQTELQQL